ncbi:hypothetical protein Tco_0133215 [Tanacetum coccineum]
MSPSNPSPLFASLHYLTIEVDFGLCEIQVGRGLGARVSGEGKVEGLSWKRESVLESGIARKRGGEVVWVLAPSGLGYRNNPEGKEYLFDLSKPLPLIMERGRQVVHADFFFNNDLEQ